MSDYVIDGLGMIHHRANFEALRERLTPSWKAVLGPGRPIDLHELFQPNVIDDLDGSLARWADDGGR